MARKRPKLRKHAGGAVAFKSSSGTPSAVAKAQTDPVAFLVERAEVSRKLKAKNGGKSYWDFTPRVLKPLPSKTAWTDLDIIGGAARAELLSKYQAEADPADAPTAHILSRRELEQKMRHYVKLMLEVPQEPFETT